MHERPENPQEQRIERLRERWNSFWQSIGPVDSAKEYFDDLVAQYSEPHRAYHTLEHIEHCLRELDSVRDDIVKSGTSLIVSAIWYHDAVYDTHANDNEEESAKLAERVLSELDFPAAHAVAEMILETKHIGVSRKKERDAHEEDTLFLDIDLAILGQPQEVFDKYEADIRKEYAWVPEDKFKDARRKVLQGFLDRPNIYATEFFRKKYEKAARENITRSLESLK